MTLVAGPEPVPLAADAEGVVRVGGTRVSLESVIHAFDEGATAEEITQRYPSLNLADVYTVIGYYLKHEVEVKDYLRERQYRSGETRRENQTRFDPAGIRERLMERRKS